MVGESRTAIITGASRGLGRAIAEKLASLGYDLVITARHSNELIDLERSLAKNLIRKNQIIQAIPCDISDEIQIGELIRQSIDTLGKLDVIINNASIFGPVGSLLDADWKLWTDTFKTNLFGTVLLCKLGAPHLIKSDRGKIINISGGGAAEPYPSLAAYATSKAAIIRFTEEFAEEMKPMGVDVNSVAPGPLNTRFVDILLEAGVEKLGQKLYDVISNIRATGGTSFTLTSELCEFLASRDSDGVTGKQISARFDNWKQFSSIKEELQNSQWFTMRRIDSSSTKIVEPK